MISRFIRRVAAAATVVAVLASQQSSHAGTISVLNASTGGSALAGQNYATFDNRTLGGSSQSAALYSLSFAGNGQVVNGSLSGQYAPPVFSGSNNQYFYPNANTSTAPPNGTDATNYISTGSGSATISLTNGPANYFGILWGSIDTYNSLTFNFTDGTTQTITGTMLGLTGTAYVNFTGSNFTSVVASSSTNSFEFDNVAYGVVPEPSSMVLCGIAGVVGMGTARLRRRRLAA